MAGWVPGRGQSFPDTVEGHDEGEEQVVLMGSILLYTTTKFPTLR